MSSPLIMLTYTKYKVVDILEEFIGKLYTPLKERVGDPKVKGVSNFPEKFLRTNRRQNIFRCST